MIIFFYPIRFLECSNKQKKNFFLLKLTHGSIFAKNIKQILSILYQ